MKAVQDSRSRLNYRRSEVDRADATGETVMSDVTDGPSREGEKDCTDALPEKLSFTWIDAVFLIISIGSYLFDTGTDTVVAIKLYKTGNPAYFGLTIFFIIVPAIVMAGFSLRWYWMDKKICEEHGVEDVVTPVWILRVIAVSFHFGPVIRYATSFYYGMKFRRSKEDKMFVYSKMIREDADAALLRLFECFMESAPQLVLQLYILAVETSYQDDHWLIVSIQVFSLIGSLFSVAWSLVSYHRTLRISLSSKTNIRLLGSFVQLLWHLFMISARVLALALFASIHPIWFAIAIVTHWGIMTLWIISMKTEFCQHKWEELIYNAVLGIIYIFCYFNAVDTPTRFRYTFYYVITFVENSIFIISWYYLCNQTLWYRHVALVGQMSAFFIGITFMIIYYVLLHPVGSVTVKICAPEDHRQSSNELNDDGSVDRVDSNCADVSNNSIADHVKTNGFNDDRKKPIETVV